MWSCMKCTVISFHLFRTLAAGCIILLPTITHHNSLVGSEYRIYMSIYRLITHTSPGLSIPLSLSKPFSFVPLQFPTSVITYLDLTPLIRTWLSHRNSTAPTLQSQFICFRMPITSIAHLFKFINSYPLFLLESTPPLCTSLCDQYTTQHNLQIPYFFSLFSFHKLKELPFISQDFLPEQTSTVLSLIFR